MLVYHPQAPYQGIPAENVFFASDERGNDCGVGFAMLLYQPHIFQERPVNIYFQIDAQPDARHMLLGALLARAAGMRAQFPGQKARVYTSVDIKDAVMIDFCRHNGLKMNDAEDLVELSSPERPAKLPMSFEFGGVPLGNDLEQNAFLMRMNAYRVASISWGMLAAYGSSQRFLAMAAYKNGMPTGEILAAGDGQTAFIGGLYVLPQYRRIGLGRALVNRTMEMMRGAGVLHVNAFVLRRSPAQQRMAAFFGANALRATAIYPGYDID